jgi:hypothetical protein
LKRTCQAEFEKAVQASISALERLKITITEKTSGSLETKIDAKRSNGTPVTVKLEMISLNITEISVRTGTFGLWDRKTSELIHASIAQRL